MLKFEILNELTLKVTSDGNGSDQFFSKLGAWIGGECYGNQNWKFDRVLLGPEGNPMQAAIKQIFRRVTGENLPLTKVTYNGPSITYFANEAQHVVPIKLGYGEQLNVESENILGFYNCQYGVRFLGTGVISQKGLATSTLTGLSDNSFAIVLVDGNPLVLSNVQNGSTIQCDSDAMVCFTGKAEPSVGFNLGIKNLLGRIGANGESYFMYWNQSKPTTVIIQPNERTSGIDIGMDGKGGKPTSQDNHMFRQDGNQMFNGGNQGGNPLGGLGGLGGGNQGGNPLGGLGGIIGGIINS